MGSSSVGTGLALTLIQLLRVCSRRGSVLMIFREKQEVDSRQATAGGKRTSGSRRIQQAVFVPEMWAEGIM